MGCNPWLPIFYMVAHIRCAGKKKSCLNALGTHVLCVTYMGRISDLAWNRQGKVYDTMVRIYSIRDSHQSAYNPLCIITYIDRSLCANSHMLGILLEIKHSVLNT